ncbi:MAG: adenylate kinase [Candidatus Hydrogenedentes bacterium]|nr:adenylate kinase [Candidatus Hydrogenedentota bacterium]MBI3119397.1 adenylate kinase [Candidatus Hydrogenedentota bacterium]
MIIMGAPGAGKGTQTRRIVAAYGVPHVSTGEIFRQNIKAGTPLGALVRSHIEEGHLAPDDVMCKVVNARLREGDCREGFVLDGFPRSRRQALYLDQILEELGERLDLVINLAVDEDEIVARLSARRNCPQCGAIYNLRSEPPANGLFCDSPGCDKVTLVQRKDDHEETIRERLRVYHQMNEPVLDFYGQLNRLYHVDGVAKDPLEIYLGIDRLIRSMAPVPGR